MNELLNFAKVVKDCTGGNAKIKQSNYLSEGFLPVVDQGQELIAGYVDDESVKYKGTLPCVIFGDHTCLLKYVDFDFVLGADGTKILVPDSDKINVKYLYYFLNTVHIPDRGYSRHFKYLKRCKIPIVSLSEQKQIVQTLDTADTLRQKRKEQLNLLDDYLKSVFFEMFGDPIHNSKKWNSCEVHNLCSKIIDCPHSTPKYTDVITDYPCIRSSDLQDGFIDYTTTKYVDYSVYQDRTQRCVPGEGDVLYCREGARYGSSGYLPSGVKACLGQRTMMFRAMPDKVTSEFLWGLISSDSIYFQAKQMAGGAASPHINVKDIKKYKAFIPPIELQNKFTNIFKLIQITKQKMRASLDEMDNYFNALMQRYFG